jgi:hypothetical protein
MPVSVKVLNGSFELLADIDSFSELYFTRKLLEPGDFALSMPLSGKGSEAIKNGEFILCGNYSNKIGVIEETEKRRGAKGIDWIIARGFEAKSILKRRIILAPEGSERFELEAPVETVMKSAVKSQCGEGAQAGRRFQSFAVSGDLGRGASYPLACRQVSLLDTLSRCGRSARVGFSTALDISERTLIFDVIIGKNRSAEQNENGRALFSERYDTLLSAELREGRTGYANTLYLLGGLSEGTRSAATVWEGAEPCGIDRFERPIEARTLQEAEALEVYGRSRLNEYAETFFLEIEVPCDSTLRLDRDYALGDLCSVEAYGTWFTVPLESIEERWTKDGPGIRLGFGYPEQGAHSAAMRETRDLWEALGAL